MRRARVAAGWLLALLPFVSLSAGCGAGRHQMDQALLARKTTVPDQEPVLRGYAVRFPDVLDVRIDGHPELSGRRPISIDGRVQLGPDAAVRVEGQSAPAAAASVAEAVGVEPGRVVVAVAEFNSQQVFLHGEVAGDARAVAYQGPETVLELLHRTGGITAGAAPQDIQVVRARVAEGKQPEVFEVDLESILVRGDHQTNLRLLPFDQVHVGATRQCALQKCLPPWLRPLYDKLNGMSRPKADPSATPTPQPSIREELKRRRKPPAAAGEPPA